MFGSLARPLYRMASNPSLFSEEPYRCSVCLLSVRERHSFSCYESNICQACTDERMYTHCNATADSAMGTVEKRNRMSTNVGVLALSMRKLRLHRHEICTVLSVADLLLPFIFKLYGRGIISMHVKNKVIEVGGLKGADVLLDCVETAIKAKPQRWHAIFNIMKDIEDFKDILEKMENTDLTDAEDAVELCEDQSGLRLINDFEEAREMARDLQEQFKALLRCVYRCIKDEDAGEIKLLIANHLSCDGEIPVNILAKLDELDSRDTPSSILTFLVSRKLVGYLNYEILSGLFKDFGKQELYLSYEKAHDNFLQSVSWSLLIELFREEPELAPPSDIGLPTLKVHLSEPWEGKSVYTWKAFIKNRFYLLPGLSIFKITRKCILIQYAVLPFIASTAVEEFSNKEVLQNLKAVEVAIELSDELLEIEFNSTSYSLLELYATELFQVMKNPILVAHQLFAENVLSEAVTSEIDQCLSLSDQKCFLLGSVFESLRHDHRNLKVFASILLCYRDTVIIGKSLLNQYSLKYVYAEKSSDSWTSNKDASSDSNDSLSMAEYNGLVEAVNEIFSSVTVSLNSETIDISEVKSFMMSFSELSVEIGVSESVADVLAVIQCYTSLVNMFYLKALMCHFQIHETGVIQLYEDKLTELCKGAPLSFFDGRKLMKMFKRGLLNSEKLLISLDQSWLERSLRELMLMLKETMRVVYTNIIIKEIHKRDDAVIILSYFPQRLNCLLIKTVQLNERRLFTEGVIAIDLGDCNILRFKKEPELAESLTLVDKKLHLGILKENEELRHEIAVLHSQVNFAVAEKRHHLITRDISFKTGAWRFLTSVLYLKWFNIVQEMKAKGVAAFSSTTLKLEGDSNAVYEIESQIHKLKSSVKESQFPVTRSVAHFLFDDSKGQPVVKSIEKNTGVCIEQETIIVSAATSDSVPSHTNTSGLSSGIYQNIKITKGDILAHQEDVVVCSVGGDVSNALFRAAGKGVHEELMAISGFDEDLVITKGYNLISSYIFHLRLLRYYTEDESEPYLKRILRKCLVECTRLNAKSISIPSIGAGHLGYHPRFLSKCFLEEAIDYLTKNQGKTSLQLIHFVLFEENCHKEFVHQFSGMLSCNLRIKEDSDFIEQDVHYGTRQETLEESNSILYIYGEADSSLKLAVERLKYVGSVMIHIGTADHTLGALFKEVLESLEENSISFNNFSSFITFNYPEFINKMYSCDTIMAALDIIHACTSLVNPVYLRDIAEHFKLKGIIMKLSEYTESIKYLQQDIPLKKFHETLFMHSFDSFGMIKGFKILNVHLDPSWSEKSIKDLSKLEVNGLPVGSRYVNLHKVEFMGWYTFVSFVFPMHLVTDH